MTPEFFEQRVREEASNYSAPDDHDISDEGTRPLSLTEFLEEVEQVLAPGGIL